MTTGTIEIQHSQINTTVKRPIFIIILIFSLFILPALAPGKPLSGLEIIKRVNQKERGRTSSTTTEMVLIGKNGQKKSRLIRSFTKHKTDIIKKILFVLSPPGVKGTALLTYDYPSTSRETEQWIYLPALHRTKRVSAGNRSGSFMGSDFSYGDLIRKSLNAYSYTVIKEQVHKGHPVWIIEAIPKNTEIIQQFGYTKSLLIVRKDNFIVVGSIHWLKDKNTLKYHEVTELEKIDGIWIPTKVSAKTVSNGETVHRTIVINKDIKFNQPIADQIFSKRKLQLGLQ